MKNKFPKDDYKIRRRQKQKSKLVWVIVILFSLAIASMLILNAFKKTIIFYHSINDVVSGKVKQNEKFRIGGLISEISTVGTDSNFTLTDGKSNIKVIFKGVLPALFVSGSGGVVEGHLRSDNIFIATEALAKHDENYIPKEVESSLKASGMWNGDK